MSSGLSRLSRCQRLGVAAPQVFLDDAVALGMERDDADVRPVARVAGPSRRMAFTGLEVERVARGQDGDIATVMALGGADVADAAVVMFDGVVQKGAILGDTFSSRAPWICWRTLSKMSSRMRRCGESDDHQQRLASASKVLPCFEPRPFSG